MAVEAADIRARRKNFGTQDDSWVAGEEDGHGWEYLCEWEGEQSDSWVWHDKMASVGYVACR